MKTILALLAVAVSLSGCYSDANIASSNLTKAADNFELNRRIVFYNGITGEYMLVIEGLCSIGSATETKAVAITCKTGPTEYKKHFLGLSDNVTYISEQINAAPVDVFHYRVIFKPQSIIPDIDLKVK